MPWSQIGARPLTRNLSQDISLARKSYYTKNISAHLREKGQFMMTSSSENFFPRYWPFVRGIHRSPPWMNGWVNNREANDLRRHRTYYEVIVLFITSYQGDLLRDPDRDWLLSSVSVGIWTPHSPVLIKISADKGPLNQLAVQNWFLN